MNYAIHHTKYVTGLRHFSEENFRPLGTPVETTTSAVRFTRDTRVLLVPDMVMTRESCKQAFWVVVMTSRPLRIAVMGYQNGCMDPDWDIREACEVFVDAVFDKWDNDRETFLKMFPLAKEDVAKEQGITETSVL